MIYCRLYGGLGNQMFQYAFCRMMQEYTGQMICLDASDGSECASPSGDSKLESMFCKFMIDLEKTLFIFDRNDFDKKAGRKMKLTDVSTIVPRMIRKIIKSNSLYKKNVFLVQKIFNKYNIYSAFDCYCDFLMPNKEEDVYVNGLFTSKSYYEDIRNVLCREFSYDMSFDPQNTKYLKLIENTNSTCMHVRKGRSYTDNSYLNVCGKDYYETAIKIIKEKCVAPVVFVFSNDFEWCKNNICFDGVQTVFVDANDSWHAVEEIQLMKRCKNFILSNSTMSWWAQYLCEEKNLVVSPSRWSIGKIDLLGDLLEDTWIKVEV